MNLVIDASVSAKWFFSEADTESAIALLEACERGVVELLAPEILPAEMANLIWKKISRVSVDAGHGFAFLDRFQQVPIFLHAHSPLAAAALRLAVRLHHPVYDCLYVILALRENCPLVTADQKLFRVFNPLFPFVRILSGWNLGAEL